MPFPLLQLLWIIAILVITGVILWGLNNWPNLDGTIKTMIRIIVIVVMSIWVIYLVFGLIAGMGPLPRFR